MIDDDNLPKMMEEAESRHAAGSALKFLKTGEDNGFKVAAPDVTCSPPLSAPAQSRLLQRGYAQMEDSQQTRCRSWKDQRTIEGDALLVSVYNRTDWHLAKLPWL